MVVPLACVAWATRACHSGVFVTGVVFGTVNVTGVALSLLMVFSVTTVAENTALPLRRGE